MDMIRNALTVYFEGRRENVCIFNDVFGTTM